MQDKEARLNRFSNDIATNKVVYDFIRDVFLSKKGVRDVNHLAAERLAVELLDNAWILLDKYKSLPDSQNTIKNNFI